MSLVEDKEYSFKTGIRTAGIEDAGKIAEINFKAVSGYYRGMINDEFLDSLELQSVVLRRKNNLLEEQANGDTFTLVYEENGEVLGYIKGGVIRRDRGLTEEIESYKNELYSFYMDLDYRGKGIGTKLIEAYKEHLKGLGIHQFFVGCLKDNSASRKFYENAGGVLCGERKLTFGNYDHDEVLYKYDI